MSLRAAFPLSLCIVCMWTVAASAGSSNSLRDVSPDGKYVLAANRDNDSVTVVDASTRSVLREIKVGALPEGVTWIGNGPRAAVTCYGGHQVAVFDALSGQIVKKLS